MRGGEWPRSRFWHCHFLSSRHARPRIDWRGPAELDAALSGPLCRWFADTLDGGSDADQWLVAEALRDDRADPAYTQSLRLVSRERHHHRELIRRLLERYGATEAAGASPLRRPLGRLAAGVRRHLGVRFELSVRLLAGLLDLALLSLLEGACPDRAWRGVAATLGAEKRGHVLFFAERLTLLYADFNFVRRNLRRLRLRLMWGACLLYAAWRHGRLIRAAGATRRRLLAQAIRHFAPLLEQVVPYRRDALLATLLSQRREPWARPTGLPQ